MRYLITANNISLNYDGNTKVVEKSDSRFGAILEALKAKTFDKIPGIVDGLKNAIEISSSDGNGFTVEHGAVHIDGTMVTGKISERIVEYVNAGLDPASLVNFWRNLQQNPSYRAREALFTFLEHGGHPFTDDGCFIAYKKVNANMTDNYTGKIDNSVGCRVTMDRNLVDDDPTHTCAPGLHVASWNYAQGYSGVVLIDLKVNPRDVVSVPTEHNFEKMRVCEYEVIALSKGNREELHVSEPVDVVEDAEEDYENDMDDNSDELVDTNHPDYIQGTTDANALITYFQSIGKPMNINDFLALKRFAHKTEEYMAGVADEANSRLV